MADSRSKVTLRPRSKLERLLALLDVNTKGTPQPFDLGDLKSPSAEHAAASPKSGSAKVASSTSVAPTPEAARVAVRLGYPGNDIRAVGRALDAEVPEGDAAQVALRAHHLLHAHGTTVCFKVEPACASCKVRAACAYKGVGSDPADRLEARATTEG